MVSKRKNKRLIWVSLFYGGMISGYVKCLTRQGKHSVNWHEQTDQTVQISRSFDFLFCFMAYQPL